jgi:protein translocase SecG subunit
MKHIIQFLPHIQIILSIILIGLILLQQSDADLGGTFGGSDSINATHTRRGAEKLIYNVTIITGILFVIAAAISFLIK